MSTVKIRSSEIINRINHEISHREAQVFWLSQQNATLQKIYRKNIPIVVQYRKDHVVTILRINRTIIIFFGLSKHSSSALFHGKFFKLASTIALYLVSFTVQHHNFSQGKEFVTTQRNSAKPGVTLSMCKLSASSQGNTLLSLNVKVLKW